MNESSVSQSSYSSTPMTGAEEMKLIDGLLAGSPSAWREFSGRFSRMIESCIVRITHRFPGIVGPEDAREIYALFCLNLLANDSRKLRTFDPARGTRFSSWLGLIAVHTAYDYLRTARRQPHGPCVDDIAELVAHVPEAAENCVRKEQAKQVARLVEELSERDREFMALYFADGLSADQVARKMGISVKTVYTKKHKIRSRLESLVSQQQAAA